MKENQLLKDRKKGKRKQPSQGENCAPTIPLTISNQGKPSGQDDTHAIKVMDNDNIKQVGPLKGPSAKRNVNVGINRSICKGDPFPPRTVRQRRRTGNFNFYFSLGICCCFPPFPGKYECRTQGYRMYPQFTC